MAQKFVNLYETEAAYTADASNRPSTSSVSYAIDQNKVHYDGVNIITTASPKVGDAVYGDTTTGKAIFYDGATLQTQASGADAGTPIGTTGLKKIGFVVGRKGRKVLIHWWESDHQEKFAAVWQWEVTLTTYASQPLVLKQYDGSAMTEVFRFTTSSSTTTLGAFVSELNTQLRATGHDPNGYNWHCDKGENYNGDTVALITCDNNSPYQRYQTPMFASDGTTAVCSLTMCNYLPAFSKLTRKDGRSFDNYVVMNVDRYIANNSNTDTIGNLASFTADADLVAKYGSGESGFRAYLNDQMAMVPCSTNGYPICYGKSRDWSKWMAGRTYTKLGESSTSKQFSAAAWCDSVGISGISQLQPGDFYMAGFEEALSFMGNMIYPNDVLDMTAAKMGTNTSLLANSRWLGARRYTYNAWFFNSTGVSTTPYFLNTYRVSAVALFDLDA